MTIEKTPGTQHTTTDRKKVIKRSLLIGFFIGLVVTIYSYLIVGFLCGWFAFILAHNIQCAYLKIQLSVLDKSKIVQEEDIWKQRLYNPASPFYEEPTDFNHYLN